MDTDQQDSPPISYGDLRVTSDRSKGSCLFWVVPDVAPGFNVPFFYNDFIKERREDVSAAVARRAEQRARSGQQQQNRSGQQQSNRR